MRNLIVEMFDAAISYGSMECKYKYDFVFIFNVLIPGTHSCGFLCSFIDLPNLSSSIYSTELYSRLREFLVACPPAGPSPPVAELVVATADFQRDLSLWNIR